MSSLCVRVDTGDKPGNHRIDLKSEGVSEGFSSVDRLGRILRMRLDLGDRLHGSVGVLVRLVIIRSILVGARQGWRRRGLREGRKHSNLTAGNCLAGGEAGRPLEVKATLYGT